MKLINLSCDQPSFHPIEFRASGPTLIIGDGATDKQHEGSSNGVGKTLLLYLVHHCLGAKADPRLRKAVPKWNFCLRVELAGTEYAIERLGDGNRVKVNGDRIAQKDLREWLNEIGAFDIDNDVPGLSFRSLIKRFSRYRREDCVDPLRMNKEPDVESLFRTLYLLGLDCSLAVSKQRNKLEIDEVGDAETLTKNDVVLREVLRTGAQPRLRLEWLEAEIPQLRSQIGGFQVAENYRHIELHASELTRSLREMETAISVLSFQETAIEKSLLEHPDITRDDLLSLYRGLGEIFKREALIHFEKVEAFRSELVTNRKRRLNDEKSTLAARRLRLETERGQIAQRRDEALNSLSGKKALDEYAAVCARLAGYEEERKTLQSFLNLSAEFQRKKQALRERQVEEDRLAIDYLASNPVANADLNFKKAARVMYPDAPSGIVIENNINDNQIRYNISVEIEGDDSDGINSARILSFDWLLLLHGAHHNIDFLWHDNRLFADIDPKCRAAWFANVLQVIPHTGKQYIAALNTENYDAMRPFLSDAQVAELESMVALRLRGDNPVHKLLGIQFG